MICCSIVADTKEKVIGDILSLGNRADIIEIRLDFIDDLDEEFISEIIKKKDKPAIFTCRNRKEGGKYKGSEEDRLSLLKKCAEEGADYVDIELDSYDKFTPMLGKKECRIIASCHDFDGCDDIEKAYVKLSAKDADHLKLVCNAKKLSDNLKVLEFLEKSDDKRLIAFCMGELGQMSRVLCLAYGSYLTYGCLEAEAAPGQISVEWLRRLYRADKLKLDGLKIYGLVGNPVNKSRGFILHNLGFKDNGINAVYLNFLVDDLSEFMHDFKGMFSGFSVTMPYKEEIIKYLDSIDESAEKIGAVNTVVKKDGKLLGYNTDMKGAIDAIQEKTQIKDKNVLMLGAGGAARAIGYGIVNKGGNLTIANRTEGRGKKLATELDCTFKKLPEVDWADVDILINATPVGMGEEESPVEKEHLKDIVVFDSIYNPVLTKLLHDAEQGGCKTINGLSMFVNQALLQFELFTGEKADIELIEQRILGHILYDEAED